MSRSILKESHQRITAERDRALGLARDSAGLVSLYLSEGSYYDIISAEQSIIELLRHLTKVQANQSMLFGIELATQELKEETNNEL